MQRPWNILRVITWLPIGGIERRLAAVLPRIDRSRFNVSLVCIRELGPLADELKAAGIDVTLIPFRKRWDLRGLRQLAAYMREREIDLVHSHMYRSNVPATVAARMAGVKEVWGQVHNVGTWETRRQAWMDRQLCRWRSGMIGVSERVCADIEQQLGLASERIKLIYNGVEIGRFAAARERREEFRRELGVAEDDCVVIDTARMVEQKRPQDFLQAVGMLQSQPGAEQLKIWMLGDGPLRPELEAAAARLPMPGNIKFFGKCDDVERYLAAADIFVLPSTKEGFSNALVEAMASGLACIASDVGGNAEAIETGRDGLIIPPRAPRALEQSLETLWRNAPDRQKMSQAASERAKLFDLDSMVKQVEEFYVERLEIREETINNFGACP